MKRDYYEVLGVSRDADENAIKKAFRKLSSAHHPDKHVAAPDSAEHEARFKEVNEAYQVLSDPKKRSAYDNFGADDDDSWESMRAQWDRAHGNQGFRQFRVMREVGRQVTLKEAYEGFEVQIGTSKHKIQGGTPYGYRTPIQVNDNLIVVVQTLIVDPRFKITDPNNCGYTVKLIDGINVMELETSPVETSIDVDALDIMLGTWVKTTDFMGEELLVRVPAGFQPTSKLKVKGKGYVNWLHQLKRPYHFRGDMFVTINPIFKAPKDLDKSKVEALLALTSGVGVQA